MTDQEKIFKGIVPPPIVFFALMLIGFICQGLFPLNFMINNWPSRLLIALPLFIASGLTAINALTIMKKNSTAVNFNNPTTKFIVAGSFRFTRNPLYLSLLLVMAGIAVVANSAWHLIAFIILFLFLNFGIVVLEEQYLENCFGKEYTQYKSRVRRWI